MSDLSKRLFDLGASRDEWYNDMADDTLVRLRIAHQKMANQIADELEYRQLMALQAVKS